jgi:hypothetical protein
MTDASNTAATPAPQPGGRPCAKCGSARAQIEWDPRQRVWFCTLRAEVEAPKRPSEPVFRARRAGERDPNAERPLDGLSCDRCGRELLAGAADGVAVYCAKCRRWVEREVPA